MSIDVSELRALSADLGRADTAVVTAVTGVFREAAGDVQREWRRNAAESSGRAARHYPQSITATTKVGMGIVVEVGPERRGQGKLAPILEYGSPTSPPHLDGQRAADTVAPQLERQVSATVGSVLGRVL